jgi:hypothetical protein
MEGIAAASSLITVISALSFAVRSSIDVCQNVHDAPAEVAAFTTHLLILKAELEYLQSSGPEIYQKFAGPQDSADLSTAFDSARTNLAALNEACHGLQRENNTSLRRRLRWAYLDRPAAGKLLRNIRITEGSLSTILSLLTLYV